MISLGFEWGLKSLEGEFNLIEDSKVKSTLNNNNNEKMIDCYYLSIKATLQVC